MKRTSFAGLVGVACGIAAMLASMPLGATTTEMTWNDVDLQTSGSWGRPENWLDANGQAPAVAPTNAADHFAVMLPALSFAQVNKVWQGKFGKTISTGGLFGEGNSTTLAEYSVNPVIDSIGADESWITHRYTIMAGLSAKEYCIPPQRLFSVRDPNGFRGMWIAGYANTVFELRAENAFTPVMHAFDTAKAPTVRVPDIGTEAVIGGIRGGGTVYKTGNGTLEVAGGATEGANYIVKEGSLRLDGRGTNDTAILERLFSEALLHLDASVPDTLVVSNDSGFAWITRWNDVRGNNSYGYSENFSSTNDKLYPYSMPPFRSPALSPTGLPLVDFGANTAGQVAELGPLYCHMVMSPSLNNVREAVYAVQTPKGPVNCTILGSSSATYDWISDGTGGTFFSVGYEANNGAKVPKGSFTINGAPTLINEFASLPSSTLTNMLVMHACPIGNTSVNALGTDRHSRERSGGSRMGEILLFSRELTRAERTALDRYLVRKWVDGSSYSANGVCLAADAAIDVSEGYAPHVGVVSAAGSTIVKTGPGTLEMDGAAAVAGAPKIDVRAGGVRFSDAETTTNAPAEGAYIWLDASKTDTFTYAQAGGGEPAYVTEWKDCRPGVNLVATARAFNAGCLPFTVDGETRGLSTVNLGDGGNSASGTQCFFALPTWSSSSVADTYAGFVVVRFHDTNNSVPFFGSRNLEFLRSGGVLSAHSYLQPNAISAFWTVNGRQTDALEQCDDLKQSDRFVVIAFRSLTPMMLGAIAKDRYSGSAYVCGNMTIGEFITYHRQITPGEFRATEAYLMAKWLGARHPARDGVIGELSFAAGADAVVDTDRDLFVEKVSGGNGRIVKKGAGNATVEGFRPGIDSPDIVVEEGNLTIGSSSNLMNEALFHFDASDMDSLTYYVEDGVTNVTAAADVRGNGLVARSAYDGANAGVVPSNYATNNPILEMVETKPGVWRRAFDFGDRNAKDIGREKAAAFYFQLNGASTYFTNVRETFVVARQKQGDKYVFVNILGSGFYSTGSSTNTVPSALNYYRGTAELVNSTYGYAGFANNGSVRVDGVDGAGYTATLNYEDGFRLLEFIPGGNTRVGGLTLDRTATVGGSWICEVIGFSRELTTDERAFLRSTMRAKWFEDTPWPSTGSLAVTVGAGTLSFSGVPIAPSSLSVTVPPGTPEGVYVLATSEAGFADPDISRWNVSIAIRNAYSCRLELNGTELRAIITKKGLRVHLR